MRRVIAAVVLAVVLISGCSVSIDSKPSESSTSASPSQKVQAQSPSQVFLTVVHKQIPVTAVIPDNKLVTLGNAICSDFRSDADITNSDLLAYIMGISKGSKGNFTIKDSAALVAAAGYALCPEVLKQPLDDFKNGTNTVSS